MFLFTLQIVDFLFWGAMASPEASTAVTTPPASGSASASEKLGEMEAMR